VALTEDGKIVCLPADQVQRRWHLPGAMGGYLEPGEEPMAAARRELREETGYEARTGPALGHFQVDANRGAELPISSWRKAHIGWVIFILTIWKNKNCSY